MLQFCLLLGEKNEAWKYHLNGQWFDDNTVKLECSDDGDVTTTPHPTGQSLSANTSKEFEQADQPSIFGLLLRQA